MVNIIKGVTLLAVGAGLIILCGMAFAAWWGLCFGSVVLGIAIIILAPHLLMLPLPIGIAGVGFFGLGVACFGESELSPIAKKVQTENLSKRNSQTIWQAVTLGDKNLVLSIIESGEDINMLDGVKQTAVDIAKNLGRSEIEELLRRHGGKSAREL